jgi:hypothetical protein
MAAAASFYHLPPRVLPAIQAVEGGRPGLIQPNAQWHRRSGTDANQQYLDRTAGPICPYAGADVAYRLLDDPCFNIAAAAAIIRSYLSEAQGNVMIAIEFYHSHTPGFGAINQQKVLDAAETLFSGKRHQTR